MNVIAVFNEKSGTAASDDAVTEQSLREAFAASGFQAAVHLLPPDRIEPFLEQAVAARPGALFVGGGDGTISTAARHLVSTGVPLGVLPLGSLNHFAKDLGLPPGWREAIAALAGGAVRKVDVGEVNGSIFINNCSIGAYADAVRHREALRQQRRHGKRFAMFVAAFRVFRRLRRIRFQLKSPEFEYSLRSPFLLVANNRYAGNIIAHSLRDRLDEGRLWIYATRARKHFAVLRMIWQAVLRELDAASDLESHPATEVTIHVNTSVVPVAIDGEIRELQTPLHFCIRPGALLVLAPSKAVPAPAS